MADERTKLEQDGYQDSAGIWRWRSNDRVPFDDLLAEAGVAEDVRARCDEARRVETALALAQYRQNRAAMTPDERAAEAAEVRAAFGEGPVVNIITGERII